MSAPLRRPGKHSTWISMLSVVGLVLILAGCGTSAVPQAAPPHRASHSLTPVHVQLNWLSNVEFSGLWVADHLGWFKRAGIKLDYRPWSNGINPEEVTSACTGYCFGFDDSAAIAIARSVGNNVKAVWAEAQKTPFAYITCKITRSARINSRCKSRTHRNITTPKQWRGLRIGYQSHELYVPEVMLGSVGLSLKDVKPVVIQFDPSVLTTGTVDAYLAFINNEPISLSLQGVQTNIIPAYKYGFGAFYSDVMFGTDSEIRAHPQFVRKFVRLVNRGWLYAMHHTKQVADMVVRYYSPEEFGVRTNMRQQELELKAYEQSLARNPSGHFSGRMTLARWKRIIHILATFPADPSGKPVISHPINAAAAFTNTFAP